ncbi:MAG: hypothetical protein ABF811_01315 [Pseudoclavibacter sp.]
MSTNVVSVRLPEDLKQRLDRLSMHTGRPAAFYVREPSKNRWGIGDGAGQAEAIRAGREPTASLDEVLGELGISPEEIQCLPRSDASIGRQRHPCLFATALGASVQQRRTTGAEET